MKNKYEPVLSACTSFLLSLLKHAITFAMIGGMAIMYYQAGKGGLFDDFEKKECVQKEYESKRAPQNISEVTDEE